MGYGETQKHTGGYLKKGSLTRYLSERPRPALHSELGVAKLAVAGVGGGEPLLQAALVHRAQGAGAVAGGEQPLLAGALVADPAHGPVATAAANRGANQH